MKKLYHLYNENLEITHAEFFEEGQQPENAVFVEVINFVKPMFNPTTLEVYEGATPEELSNVNQSSGTILNLKLATNPTPQDGDLWLDATGLKFHHNGITKTITLT